MAIASSFKALADLYKSVGKRLPWTEQELLSGLPKGRAIAPQDLALEAARREAEAQGLPASNTLMDRAKVMGWDVPAYHGRGEQGSKVNYASSDPYVASGYAYVRPEEKAGGALLERSERLFDRMSARYSPNVRTYTTRGDQLFDNEPELLKYRKRIDLADTALWNANGLLDKAYDLRGADAQVLPLLLRTADAHKADAGGLDWSLVNGKIIAGAGQAPVVQIKNVMDTATGEPIKATTYKLNDPSAARSRFAAFNPALKDSSNLLAGLGGAAVGAGALMAPGESEAGIGGVLAKTADHAALKIAQQAEAKGLPMAKVYDATGWAKGADGKWRWEFDDSGARIDHAKTLDAIQNREGLMPPVHVRSVQGMLEHPAMEDAYPSIMYGKGSPSVTYDPNMYGGKYFPGMNAISFGGETEPVARSTLLHETQHAIQTREGFARGGDPSEFSYGPATELTNKGNALYKTLTSPVARKLEDAKGDFRSIIAVGKEHPEEYKAINDALNELQVGSIAEGIEASNRFYKEADFVAPYNQYRRLAGEVEARNIQTRMGMSPDDRRMRPFWQTEDVPRADQIIRGQADSPYANMMALKRAADARARTHAAPRVPGKAELTGRQILESLFNPTTYLPLSLTPRELGRPEDLRLVNGEWR